MTQEPKKEPRKGNGMTQAWRDRLGEAIRIRREQRNWTQDTFAQRLREVSGDKEFYTGKEAISKIESGHSAPPWDKMLLIARLLGTTIEAMASLEAPQIPPFSYTQNVHGDSYTENAIMNGPPAAEVAHHVLTHLQRHGVYFRCVTCQEPLATDTKPPTQETGT